MFFLKCYHQKANFNITDYTNFNQFEGEVRTRNMVANSCLHVRKNRLESTAHFYPYRITKIWNALPRHLQLSLKTVWQPLVVKQFLVPYYREKLVNQFDPDNTCTWISWCSCRRCSWTAACGRRTSGPKDTKIAWCHHPHLSCITSQPSPPLGTLT